MDIIDQKNVRLGNFIKHIQQNPFQIRNQRCFGDRKYMFFEDHFTIEMAKYFYIGERKYRSYPIPRRLIGIESFSVEKIIFECEKLKYKIKSAISENKKKPVADLRIFNVGRGLDLLLLIHNLKWRQIVCIDEDSRYSELITNFFHGCIFSVDEGRMKSKSEYVYHSIKSCK